MARGAAAAPRATPEAAVTRTISGSLDSPADFAAYREVHRADSVGVRTSQSGRATIQPAREFCRAGEPRAKNSAELGARIRAVWHDLLGPSFANRGPLEAKVLSEQTFPEFVRCEVEYTGDPGERIRAWLFLPTHRTGKRPAVLCLHQTSRFGKDEAAGLAGRPELAFGPELARRGYVTLCPDAIGFGRRRGAPGGSPCDYGDLGRIAGAAGGRSVMGKMLDDTRRAVDFLAAHPAVDSARIGVAGHSHGGYGALFALAFEERLSAAVVSCGFACLREDTQPDRWFRKTALLPRLGQYENRWADAPVDFPLLLAACAPRALYVSVSVHDPVFPARWDVPALTRDVRAVYTEADAAERFDLFAFEAGHRFPPESSARAWAFLDRALRP